MVASLVVIQQAHEATSEDEEEYVKGLRRFARLEGDNACKVSRIYIRLEVSNFLRKR
jgi:hypothetical protein